MIRGRKLENLSNLNFRRGGRAFEAQVGGVSVVILSEVFYQHALRSDSKDG